MQRRLYPKNSVNKQFENVSCIGVIKIFLGRGTKLWTFFKRFFFFGKIDMKQVEKRKRSGGMLPRQIFENSHTCNSHFNPF